jgi:glycolate oxidase iron-sulfur subunit
MSEVGSASRKHQWIFFSRTIMTPSDPLPDFSADSLLAEANRCVSCGLCLPHCPTYKLTQSEADSPRGRIALISGAVEGRIPMNARFALHMDRCLTCRACEAVCPNHVGFGQLMDGSRAMMKSVPLDPGKEQPERKKSGLRRWVEKELIARPSRMDLLRPLLRFYQQSGLQHVLRKSSSLGETRFALLEAQLPHVGRPEGGARSWRPVYPSIGKYRGEVGLFLGCVARLTDVETINAAIFVLNRLGYTVRVPPTQTCCGALHQHGGDKRTAEQLARQNMEAFDEPGPSAIISTASGCGAQLSEYAAMFSSASSGPARSGSAESPMDASKCQHDRFVEKVFDISEFLVTAKGWDGVRLAPLPHAIAVHEPCSLRNVLRASRHAYALLTRIPEARILPLGGNDQCCGAAGTYFLDQPEMAQALLHDKLAAVEASGARYLATSNIGCAMHIAAGLRREAQEPGSEVEVLHPVTLLARQMSII